MKKAMLVLGICFLVLAVLTPLTTTLVTLLLPETFASSAKILYPANSPTPPIAAMGMITTRSNLDLVITDLNLTAEWGRKYKQPGDLTADKCRQMLTRMIQIEMPRGTSIVVIRVFSDSRAEAANIANKLTEVCRRTTPGAVIIDEAKANPVPVRPNKKLNITLSLFAGATLLVIGIALLIASRLAVKRM